MNAASISNEEQLRQQADEQLRFLADFIPQLVWFTDPTGSHTYFNQRWTDFTGYTLADSVGPDMWNNLLHPDDRQRARDVWGHSLATGEFYEIEYRFKSKEGGYRWFLGQAQAQFDENGQIKQWYGTCTDIQDQKETEFALRHREQELERAYADLEVKVTFRNLELEREVHELRQRLAE
ncbi:PAS domain-containing protein [Microvirga sp. STR05]|uniref:histidine kinase n=1 Tax=Hymenobacter duratus TaxID=2771356 RepID=A0ABR8JHZ0_9BACT|nr:PAS domain-containing protein [Hymenobacter duratus]MBD2716460.1 PAS domain-containing protein [Hymenobacter duratus]MBR7951375.1 PAS domain-containing protein [Microvirga sp. STR05]